jgi:hypothetical protein
VFDGVNYTHYQKDTCVDQEGKNRYDYNACSGFVVCETVIELFGKSSANIQRGVGHQQE